MIDNKDNVKNIEYTIVMDKSYTGPSIEELDQEAKADLKDRKIEIDSLYSMYEKMCLKDPTVLDADDAYPHTYQWRIGDKYDPAKVDVVEAALKQGKKITETEEYEKYVENVSNMNIKPESWD